MFRKILRLLSTFILIYYTSVVYGFENTSNLLASADSLFEKKQYTESLEQYEQLLQQKFYTPRMLIRLSLIKEGLGDYTYALYYLNLYYSKIPDKSVLKKMDELAERYNLEGYDYNDLVFFISIYDQYYTYIIISFLFTCFLFLVYLYLKGRGRNKFGLSPLFFMVVLGAVYIISNYSIVPEKAIVHNDASLMSAPSSGASFAGQIKKGHRVTIKGHDDIWCKIQWHDQTVYVRENNLLFLSDL